MTRRSRIRRRAEQILQAGEAAYWNKAFQQAAREVYYTARMSPREKPKLRARQRQGMVDDDSLEEAADRIFGDLTGRPETTDEVVAEAATRLFGNGRTLTDVAGWRYR